LTTVSFLSRSILSESTSFLFLKKDLLTLDSGSTASGKTSFISLSSIIGNSLIVSSSIFISSSFNSLTWDKSISVNIKFFS